MYYLHKAIPPQTTKTYTLTLCVRVLYILIKSTQKYKAIYLDLSVLVILVKYT